MSRQGLIDRLGALARKPREERRQQLGHYAHLLCALWGRQDRACPYCGRKETERWGKDGRIVEVRKCPDCRLRFTWPKSSDRFNRIFYNWLYTEKGATDMPRPEEVMPMAARGFKGTPMDFSHKVELIRAVAPAGRLFDFGASWGYATHQFSKAGYDAMGFEVSRPRAEFGRQNLGVRLVHDLKDAESERGRMDIVFSPHVMEHLPTPRPALESMARLLKTGGHLVVFVPNCGGANARRLGMAWGPLYGSKHVLSLDADFLGRALPEHGFDAPLFFSEPYDVPEIRSAVARGATLRAPEGDELMMVARRNSRLSLPSAAS